MLVRYAGEISWSGWIDEVNLQPPRSYCGDVDGAF